GLAAGINPGTLEVLQIGGKPPDKKLEMPLQHTDVQIEVSGFVALATVTQRYHNPFDRPIEAVYTFPLPDDAAVDDMRMTIGERTIKGIIKRRQEARRIYEEARDRGQRASLLEQERPNIFTQSVANIMPGDNISITIRYVNILDYSEGDYELVFPMVVGPRYIPGNVKTGHSGSGWAADTDKVPDASRITPPVLKRGERSGHDISLSVKVDAGVPLQGVHSISHAVDIEKVSAHVKHVRIHSSDTLPNKDFVLRYAVAGKAPEMAVIAHHDERGGFFTLIVQPQRTVSDRQTVSREMIFIVDTSGSMRGFPLDKSKEAMRRLINGMRSSDTFNVVRFAGGTGTLWDRPKRRTQAHANKALRYVDRMRGSGGTEMRKGILEALSQPAARGYLRIAFLLTDGHVGNETGIFRAIEKERRGARVFTLGVGSSVNRYLLDRAAEIGRGEAFYLRQDENSEKTIDKFFRRVDRPALAHIRIDWGGLDVEHLYPSKIPDLWAGQPIRIHGRYRRGGEETIVIRGLLGSRPYKKRLRVRLPENQPEHAAMAAVWAREKVRELMARMVREGETRPLVEAVTQTGLDFRLMTQWTSFVAVEEKTVNVNGKPRTVVQPVEMPEGVSYEGVFGEAQPVPAQAADSSAARHKRARGTKHKRARGTYSRSANIGKIGTKGVKKSSKKKRVKKKRFRKKAKKRAKRKRRRSSKGGRSSGGGHSSGGRRSSEERSPAPQSADLKGKSGSAPKEAGKTSGEVPEKAEKRSSRSCRIKNISVSGGLKYPHVVSVLDKGKDSLCRAFQARLKKRPNLEKILRLTLTVGADGSIAGIELKTPKDKKLSRSLRKEFKSWRFDAVAEGGQAQISFELHIK
ncbi:MAG: VWA domain-containing protein, partial [Gammaproteobacteria bacterium]|nr:VWA domain-containing protein [Gammaproteobacteria bacterium]